VASGFLAALQYTVPSLHLWRGVSALAVVITACGVIGLRLVFRGA
jgi:hypothetical protein